MFVIRLGVPEMEALWTDLCTKAEAEILTVDEARLYKNQATVLPTGLARVIPASYHLANSISRKTNCPACFSLDLALLVICWAFLKVRVKVRVGVLDENVREKFRVWGAGSALNSSMS